MRIHLQWESATLVSTFEVCVYDKRVVYKASVHNCLTLAIVYVDKY